MTTEQISAEAEARRRYNGSGGWDQATDERDTIARAAFVAGAEYALSHHPARVLPSVEDVARVLEMGVDEGLADYGTDDPALFARVVARRMTPAIRSLFAAAPTVQQVRAEAWDEGAMAVGDSWVADDRRVRNPYRARAAETEGE